MSGVKLISEEFYRKKIKLKAETKHRQSLMKHNISLSLKAKIVFFVNLGELANFFVRMLSLLSVDFVTKVGINNALNFVTVDIYCVKINKKSSSCGLNFPYKFYYNKFHCNGSSIKFLISKMFAYQCLTMSQP